MDKKFLEEVRQTVLLGGKIDGGFVNLQKLMASEGLQNWHNKVRSEIILSWADDASKVVGVILEENENTFLFDRASFNKNKDVLTKYVSQRTFNAVDAFLAELDAKTYTYNSLIGAYRTCNKDGQPILSVWDDSDALSIFYNFPLVKASEVIVCNDFLRSLDLDIEITFESYRQYDKLIQSIFELLEQKQKATA